MNTFPINLSHKQTLARTKLFFFLPHNFNKNTFNLPSEDVGCVLNCQSGSHKPSLCFDTAQIAMETGRGGGVGPLSESHYKA